MSVVALLSSWLGSIISLVVTCDQQHSAVGLIIHCFVQYAAAGVASRSQIFPSAFSTLFRYSGWSQIVRFFSVCYYVACLDVFNYPCRSVRTSC